MEQVRLEGIQQKESLDTTYSEIELGFGAHLIEHPKDEE